jgi:transglutaminase-like putative cysteine protease
VSWRLQIRHRSAFRYGGPVWSSYNEARITPITTPWQVTLEASTTVSPSVPTQRYWDYWGSAVEAFDVQTPHHELVVTGQALVETEQPPRPDRELGWDELRSDAVADSWAELLAPTVSVPGDEALAAVGRDLSATHPPYEAANAAAEWVRSQLTYLPGRTGVRTSAMEALAGGAGVCQDFAHLTLALVRPMGIPARYCSGYLHPKADAELGEVLVGQSHAWVEVWAGDWVALDPTNGDPVGVRHVLVARGRDYTDVPPLKGIYHGGPTAALDVEVHLTRTA